MASNEEMWLEGRVAVFSHYLVLPLHFVCEAEVTPLEQAPLACSSGYQSRQAYERLTQGANVGTLGETFGENWGGGLGQEAAGPSGEQEAGGSTGGPGAGAADEEDWT
ncbi:hypothetical protein M405DRAFT_884215 [Rhizopogon salebrosus TDB-379]|nr:hypothetical protein M405DRAFT_884215 [Rhizopogon salebrosus TDB-379]